jgi:hypothetical protein
MVPHHDLSRARWRTSSYTNGGEACVEIAAADEVIAVRDSKNLDGPELRFNRAAWTAFQLKATSGGFDLHRVMQNP